MQALRCFHEGKKETFSAVRQVEQHVSIQLRKANNSLKHAMRQNAIPWLISAVKLSKLFRKENKYSFLEAYMLKRDKDHHQYQRVCSRLQIHCALPKMNVKFQNDFCVPPSDFLVMLLTSFTPF